MINANSFVCELTKKNRNKIKELITSYLIKEGHDDKKIKETILNVMEDRLWNIQEIVNIEQFFENGKVIDIRKILR